MSTSPSSRVWRGGLRPQVPRRGHGRSARLERCLLALHGLILAAFAAFSALALSTPHEHLVLEHVVRWSVLVSYGVVALALQVQGERLWQLGLLGLLVAGTSVYSVHPVPGDVSAPLTVAAFALSGVRLLRGWTYAASLAAACAAYVVGRWVFGGPELFGSSIDDLVLAVAMTFSAGMFVERLETGAREAAAADTEADLREEDLAREEAAARAVVAARRVLHDDVLTALRAVHDLGAAGSGGSSEARVRHECAAAVASVHQVVGEQDSVGASDLSPAPAEGESATVAAWLETLQSRAPVSLEVDVRAGASARSVRLDPVVAGALGRATLEALRNVARHSGAQRAEVRVGTTIEREVVVRVVDHGRGLGPDRGESFGLTHSVRSAVTDVGGTADLLQTPGGGLTVRLAVPLRPHGGPAAESEGLLWHTHSLTLLATENRSLLRAITLPMTAAWLFVSVRHSWGATERLCALFLAVCAAVVTLYVGRRLALRPVRWPAFLGMVALTWAVQVGGMVLMPPGAMLDYRSWSVGFAVVPVVVLCFFAPVPVGLLVVASHVGLVLGAHWLEPALTASTMPWGSLNAVVTTPLVGVALGWLLRHTGAAVVRERSRLTAAREALARQTTLAAASSRHLEHTRRHVLPWLRDVAEGTVPLGTPTTTERARLLGMEARDDLYAPGFYDPSLRAEVSLFRRAGGTVRLHPGFETGHWPRRTTTVLARLLRALPPTASVVLSVTDDGREVRIGVLHGDDGSAPELGPLLRDLDVSLVVDTLRTTVVIASRGLAVLPPMGGVDARSTGAVTTTS